MDENVDNEVDEDQLEADAAVTAADAAEAAEQRHLKIMSVLQQKKQLPLETRNEIDVLIEEFLNTVESNIHGMICSNNVEDYHGLDSDRDTEQEVETAIRLFPKVLTTKEVIFWFDDHDDLDGEYFYPVQLLAFSHRGDRGSRRCNLKAVSFLPLLIRLAIEFGMFAIFEEQFDGGLLIQNDWGDNVLQDLMSSDRIKLHNREHHETVDSKYLQVLVQLRRMGVFKKEDIQRYDLLGRLRINDNYLADMRFRFLTEWNPSSLINRSSLELPLHHAASRSSIQGFRSVFEAGIKYFPNKKGICLLFIKTPYQVACRRFGYEEVMKIVEDTLIRYSDTPINTTEALIMAAIDKNIHLDCVYFLLRRQPDILNQLLSSKQVAVTATTIDSSTDEATSNNCD